MVKIESNISAILICPNLSYLETVVQLICTGGGVLHSYINPRGVDVAQCPLSGGPCDPLDAPVTVINSTQTIFNIPSVQIKDVGTWSCKPGREAPGTCNLTAAKTPTCNITSKEDTDDLAQYQELTLTVDIQDYYCSTALTFSLQTGNVTTLLMEADSVASVSHNTFSVTMNVTASHLGVVGLVFNCHNSQLNLTCDGLTELKTPTCSISSDKDTDRLALNEELTLSVDIIGYNCPVASNFTLQTGNVQQLLNVSSAGAGIDRATPTFHVTKTHLGAVRLIFHCQQKHWNLTCDGITKLQTKTAALPENDGPATASTPIIAACVVVAIVCFIIAVIIIVFLVKRKQGKRRVAAGYPTSDHTVHQAEDNVVVGSGGSASGDDQQGPGLRINPVYIPTTVGGSLESYNGTVTTGTSTETGVMDGDYLHPEVMGNYLALDRNAVQPTNIYEHLRIYEQIANM
ncbi:uncharacterized protein LOC124150169 [Haliotis rufescens]|uniref:uncharacterized protein LOC124150169 n=1 Tax=Haliotis rufescens TaxID=6454 RepID=UPI00201EDDDE|nr:uncharacterized protein LOC124150169 [Haliotis rufescens]